MIFDGMKVTTNAAVPRAIIADTEVLKNAPLEMLKAGYGDIIGKFSCLNDWRLGALINGEPLCNYIYDLTYKTAKGVSKMGRAILSRDEESIASLMRSLVIVGIAMAYMGNSRPASGSEHHLSHFFEIVGLLRGEPYFCHGIDVAYSAFITAKLREKLLNIDSPKAKAFNEGEWEAAIKRVYASKNGETEAGIIAMQKKLGFIYEDKSQVYLEKWEEIKAVLEDSPTPEEFKEMLDSIELSLDDFYKTYSKEKINEAVLYGKDLKDRYSVLWLYNSLI
jgi:glycerol-1-phosphate dehydrogenase [NAD(P)+]